MLRVPIKDIDKAAEDLKHELTLLHEILDLLPYVTKEEALRSLADGDGRIIRGVGRKIRELLPDLSKDLAEDVCHTPPTKQRQ